MKLNNSKPILCHLGFHSWVITFDESPRKERKCSKCAKYQHTTYDMAYGNTYWSDGMYHSHLNELIKPRKHNNK